MIVLYLVRHGETDFNKLGKLQGRGNSILNKNGMKQVDILRKRFNDYPVDVCFSSPLIRAVQTAFTLIGDRCLFIKDDRLIERELGELEGKKRECYDIKKYWDYELNSNDLDVEKVQDLYLRVQDFITYIKANYQDKRILIVSHSAVIRCFLGILKNIDSSKLHDQKISNCYFEEIIIE